LDAWHEIAMSLRGAYLAAHRLADGEFARYGITADQFPILAVLSDGAVLPQAELCRRTYSDPNTISAMLALMETRGLIRRVRDAKDGRARSVMLKSKGMRIFAKVWANREGTRKRMEALFTSAEADILVELLNRINKEISLPQRRRRRRVTAPDGEEGLTSVSNAREFRS
jgi:DNA-binding MarR family transcriptional regulator